MKKKIEIQVANPSGNVTIFVRTKCGREEYQGIATQLLERKELQGEQVAFLREAEAGVDGAMDMCGLEFCGNASRTYGLMLALEAGEEGKGQKKVRVSGCDEVLTVDFDTKERSAKVKMPAYLTCEKVGKGAVVDFGGILHIIEPDTPATLENFNVIKEKVYETQNPPALGVMFWDTKEEKLIPVVYVKDVDTIYFEGSCGSGTTACAAAFSMGKPDGVYRWSIAQPEGVLDVEAEVKDGMAVAISIDGVVELKPAQWVEIEV